MTTVHAGLSINAPEMAEHVHDVQEALRTSSIDFRIIGSIAAAGYGVVCPEGTPPSVESDIDVIVPRYDLIAARALRKKFEKSNRPIKLGVAVPTMQVDFRPEEIESYLTVGPHALTIDTEAFASTERSFMGVDITTVPINTLHQIYRDLSPNIPKYRAKADRLAVLVDQPVDLPAFRDYQVLRTGVAPLRWRAMDLAGKVIRALPDKPANHLRAAGRIVADRLHMR